jgi:hypothetical protein
MAIYTGVAEVDAGLAAFDLVHDALGHVAKQFSPQMSKQKAEANIKIRGVLMTAQNLIMADLEDTYLQKCGIQLVREDSV